MKKTLFLLLGLGTAGLLSAGEWKIFRWPETSTVEAGSALDLSLLLPPDPAPGRIIASPGGFLALDTNPERPMRFLCNAITEGSFLSVNNNPPEFTDHESIERFVRELKRRGYRMVRSHFLDLALVGHRKGDHDFDPKVLDHFDYLVYQLKKNNLYLCFDAMTSWLGYTPGNIWNRAGIQYRNYKYTIHFDPKIRENWRKGTEKILCRRNPYTGMALAEDPVLSIVVGFNEHEIGFFYDRNDWKIARPFWLRFLKKKYGSVDRLNQVWRDGSANSSFRSFEEVPMFSSRNDFRSRSPMSARTRDYNEFATISETDTSEWMQAELKKMGCKALFSSFNCGKNLRFAYVRRGMDVVTANTYHAHPGPGHINQASSIGYSARTAQELFSMRIAGRPMVVTEHAHVFWNKYRYEQGFVTGGYSALHGFSVLTVHCSPVSLRKRGRISCFSMYNDPIHQAEELVAFFLFARGDVKPAETEIRLKAPVALLPGVTKGVNPWQSRLGLVTRIGLDLHPDGRSESLNAKTRSVNVSAEGMVRSELAYSTLEDGASDSGGFDAYLALLKKEKFLPRDNRTNGAAGVFQSATGELLLKSTENFMRIDTPRFQGICSEAGTSGNLSDVSIAGVTTRGNINAVSIDGTTPLRNARRILILFATNALNSNMEFHDPEQMSKIKKWGSTPPMLETGAFSMKIRNVHTGRWRLHALDSNGKRLETLPVAVAGGTLSLSIDTAGLKQGPTPFFELVADEYPSSRNAR